MINKKITPNPILAHNLDILFVGINPVEKSIKDGMYHYFSSNSYFYTLLYEAGITDKKINDTELLNYNLGIYNFFFDYFGDYKKVPPRLMNLYHDNLFYIINIYKSKKIAYLGKYFSKILSLPNKFGKINDSCFILPFPTFPMRKKEKLKYYRTLK